MVLEITCNFKKIRKIGGVMSLKRRSISCFAVDRVEWRVIERKVVADDSVVSLGSGYWTPK